MYGHSMTCLEQCMRVMVGDRESGKSMQSAGFDDDDEEEEEEDNATIYNSKRKTLHTK